MLNLLALNTYTYAQQFLYSGFMERKEKGMKEKGMGRKRTRKERTRWIICEIIMKFGRGHSVGVQGPLGIIR